MCVVKWFFRRIRLWYPRIEWRLILPVHVPKRLTLYNANALQLDTPSLTDRHSSLKRNSSVNPNHIPNFACLCADIVLWLYTMFVFLYKLILLSKQEKFWLYNMRTAIGSGERPWWRTAGAGTRAVLRVPVVDNASGAILGVPIKLVDWNSLVFSLIPISQKQAAV